MKKRDENKSARFFAVIAVDVCRLPEIEDRCFSSSEICVFCDTACRQRTDYDNDRMMQ